MTLSAVPDPTPTPPPAELRRRLAHVLAVLAELVADEDAPTYRVSSDEDALKYQPPVAAMIVLIDADGEPTPMLVGLEALSYDDATDVVIDAKAAVTDLMLSGPAKVREGWIDRSAWRERAKAKQREHERTHPFVCDCGQRCKSAGGLTRHKQTHPPAR